MGNGGVGLGTAHTDFLAPDPAGYFAEANANTTVICMIESMTGVKNAPSIAAVPGVDVLWVGHFDLTQTMGIPAQFGDRGMPRAWHRCRHQSRIASVG
jgi:2-keto-3-deoxy-L-rhamnonate aldolase RhmA